MEKKISLTVVILTYNEEKHIGRCIRAVQGISTHIYVVDSFSTDSTVEIAESEGAIVCQHKFVNQAAQLNWAFENLPIKTEWVMRLDADEVVTPLLAKEIACALKEADTDVSGFVINLCIHFKGHPIRHGGQYLRLLRLWRRGRARIELSWMDEHMVLTSGRAVSLKHEIIDQNLNNITWWTEKHNRYATREAIVLLDKKYKFLRHHSCPAQLKGQARVKRWIKDKIYIHLPLGWRALFFFIYRLVFRLGFLDGSMGVSFHFLQGFWYRLLVDIKVMEIEKQCAGDVEKMKKVLLAEHGISL